MHPVTVIGMTTGMDGSKRTHGGTKRSLDYLPLWVVESFCRRDGEKYMYVCALDSGAAVSDRMDLCSIMGTEELLDVIQVEGRGTREARVALADKFGVELAAAHNGPAPGESVMLTDGVRFEGAVAV